MLKQLIEKLRSILGKMDELNKRCLDKDGNVRSFTDEEQGEYDELKKQVSETRATITRLEEVEESRGIVSGLENEPTTPRVTVTRAENHNERNQYRGFRSLGEQLQAIHRAGTSDRVDRRLHEVRAAAGLNEGVDSEGGFLLQSDFIVDLQKSMMENSDLAQYCAKLSIGPNSNGSSEPINSESSRADGSRHGGVQAFWEAEAAQLTKSKPSFETLDLKLRKLTALCVATDEMLNDATQLSGYIKEVFSDEMGFKLDAALIEGSGVKEPLGIKNADALITVAKESGQTADTVVTANVLKMFSAMHKRGKGRGTWLVNGEVWAQLPLMTIGQQPVFLPAGGLTGSQFATLLGRPVIECEACEKLGDAGDIYFVDWNLYRLIEKGGVEEAQSMHVYFETAEQAFRFIVRKNGAPRIKSALTPYKANAGVKVSAFVTLAARA